MESPIKGDKYLLLNSSMSSRENSGLYLHFPFCRTKCPYCDFYSVTSLSLIPHWLEGIEKEVIFYKDRFTTFDSLYIGGGTPTLLNHRELARLMEFLFLHFMFSSDMEITIEANPDDITAEKLAFLRDLGANRISLGVQSFDEKELQFLKRRHRARQIEEALEKIRASGFTNISVDLIYGFSGQTEASWIRTLNRALDFKPEHISCYQMTIKEETLFGKMLAEGEIKALGEEKERAFFLLTSRFLEDHGYIHYEISNFAREEEYYARHNRKYWHHIPYLGLGPAAHSFRDSVRWWNLKSIESYCQALGDNKIPVAGIETLSLEQHRLESLSLGFRTKDGIDLKLVRSQPRWEEIMRELQELGLVYVHQGRAIPTREGFLVADSLSLLFSNQT